MFVKCYCLPCPHDYAPISALDHGNNQVGPRIYHPRSETQQTPISITTHLPLSGYQISHGDKSKISKYALIQISLALFVATQTSVKIITVHISIHCGINNAM